MPFRPIDTVESLMPLAVLESVSSASGEVTRTVVGNGATPSAVCTVASTFSEPHGSAEL